ncbi:GGDEF domain-containing protein [Litoribacillus peritrichatus]|uniref:diguanylate cyclase n=1 Tax=Litoribacillus peritrichatus TaxID=718191 RepID=A0ABP7N7Z3_9GAMM
MIPNLEKAASEALVKGFRQLKFDDIQLERAFERHYFGQFFQKAIPALTVGVLLYFGFIFGDRFMIPELFEESIILRVSIAIPSIFALFVIKWGRESHWQYLVTCSIFCAVNASISLLGYWAALQGQHYYQSGTLLVIMLCCTLARLPFRYAFLTTCLMLTTYGLAIGATQASPSDIFLNNLLVFSGVAFLGLVSNYQHNHDVRKDFLQSLLLNVEKERLTLDKRKFQHISNTDGLSGLYNRRFLDQRYALEWQSAMQLKTSLSVMMIDIDRFKNFNDKAGHHEGDQVITDVATTLKNSVRRTQDFVARYGGEEFIIICPSMENERAFDMAEQIRKKVESMNIPHPDGGVVSVSIGVSTTIPEESDHPSSLQKQADFALYQAKKSGRNRVHQANMTEELG